MVIIISCKKQQITPNYSVRTPSSKIDTVTIDYIHYYRQVKCKEFDQRATVYYYYNGIYDSLKINKHNFSDTTYVISNDTNYYYFSEKNIKNINFEKQYFVKEKKWYKNILKNEK